MHSLGHYGIDSTKEHSRTKPETHMLNGTTDNGNKLDNLLQCSMLLWPASIKLCSKRGAVLIIKIPSKF